VYAPMFAKYTQSPSSRGGKLIFFAIMSIPSHVGPKKVVVQDNIEWRFPQGSTDWSCVIVDNIIEISVNTIRTIILSLIDLENLFGIGVEFTGEVVSLCINLESYGRGTSTKKNGQVRL